MRTTGTNKKHEELTRTLLALIRTLRPGDPLPAHSELMRRYQLSDRTVLRSLDDLQRDGWIVRRQGIGTFVADRENATKPAGGNLPLSQSSMPVVPERSRTIAALVLAFGPVYQHFIEQLSLKAEAAGLALVCHHAHHETSFDDTLPLERLEPQGFVLFSYYLLPIAKRLQQKGQRVVIVGAPPPGVRPEVTSIYNDQDDGGCQATQHLIDLGHRRIAYVVPGTRYPLERTLRYQGHLRAIDEAARSGVTLDVTTIPCDEWNLWRDAPERCAAFFARPNAPTGLLGWNDEAAVDLLHILYSAGVRVPEDVSLVGYDALPIGSRSIPALTTVDSQIGTQVRAVMRFMTEPAESQPLLQSVIVAPTLLRRASTAPPAVRSPG